MRSQAVRGSAQFTQYSDPQEVVANGTEILIPHDKDGGYKELFLRQPA